MRTTTRVPLAIVASLALALTTAESLLNAGAQQPRAEFRAGVDLLTIEAGILDAEGRPVGDLAPGDFTVAVDGRPRKVVFADFHGAWTPQASAGATAEDPAAETGAAGTDGRIVVFVVDRDSLASGNERALLEAATTVLDRLGPGDATGLLGIPVGSVELTREQGRVRAALPMMTGTRPRQTAAQDRLITWDEALGYEQRDARVIATVVERECSDKRPPSPELRFLCPDDLVAQARQMLFDGRAHVQTVMSVLENLADRLSSLRGSKHIVFLSGGMVYGFDLQGLFDRFALKAAQAGVTLHAVHLDQPDSDASDRTRVASAFGGRDLAAGLTFLTGMTGGGYFSAVGSGRDVFERIATEVNNFYVLGVESAPDDATGTLRALRVTVNRAGLSVRTRSKVAPRVRALEGSATDPLRALLDQPTDVGELTLGVAAYSTRGTDTGTLRVLISSEIGVDRSRLPVDWGYVVLNGGNVVSTGRQRIDAGTPSPLLVTTSAKLVPGRYRLRVAATDAGGRAGVTDVVLGVGLRLAGELQLSDLIVGVADAGKLQPRARIVQGVPLSALIEVMSNDPARLQVARAVIEVIPVGTTEPVRRVLMAARTGAADTILLNGAEIDTASLAAGRYTASVVALLDNQPVGRVSRVFEVVAKP